MKKTMTLVLAAAAVAMTLASCTKEQTGTTENGQTSGLRTLTVSFATSPTRTTLDGMQPKWSVDDEILLADGNAQQIITVTEADAGKTSFEITTSLTGTITAVYPKAAADITGNTINGIKVSNAPDGEFASANICMATAAATEKELSFENQTAVIKVVVPDGTKKLTLTSLKPVGTSGQRTEVAVAIADASATTITVGNGISNIPNPCYVSILAPETGAVLLQDLNIDVDDKAQGGFSPSAIVAKGETPSTYAVETNTIYTLSKESLHEYVTVDGKKWATMNVGASSPTEYGDYFMWGETTGQKPSGSTFDPGFSWTTYNSRTEFTSAVYADSPDSANKVFKKYVPSTKAYKYGKDGTFYDNKNTLDLEDDAAFWNWGGAWRMPTNEDFTTFLNGISSYTAGEGGSFTHQGVTFPAAGSGEGSDLSVAGDRGYYLSSSLNTGDPRLAFCLRFRDGDVVSSGNNGNRYAGRSVRPLSE